TVTDAPAQEQPVFAVVPRNALAHDGPLRSAARMNAQRRIVFAHASLHGHVVRLLETDPVAVVIAHPAIFDDRAAPAIPKNSPAATTAEVNGLILHGNKDENVPLDGCLAGGVLCVCRARS